MSTINVRSYKGPVRPDGTPIELPQKVLKLTKKSNMRHKKPNRSAWATFWWAAAVPRRVCNGVSAGVRHFVLAETAG